MGRGFNTWNYMTYHLVHDYFSAKEKQKQAISKFEEKNYKNASKAAEKWIKSLRKFAENSYGVHFPKELHYGATQALLAISAEIYQSDRNWNEHRRILIEYIINNGTGGVTMADFSAAGERGGDIRAHIPLGWVEYNECGEFWTCLGRCLKRCGNANSKFEELTEPLQTYIAAFGFCGPLQSNVESIGTRYLNRALAGVERGIKAPPPKVDFWGDGTSQEHIQKMKVVWDYLLTHSDGGKEIADPQMLLSMLVGKTITDIIMYGNIPARDKLLETEMVFAENRLELGTTAREFMLDMANHGETWKLLSQMLMPRGDQMPMFWQIAQIMSIKANGKDMLDELISAYMNFAYCFVSEMMKEYPNGGYDRDSLLPYLEKILPTNAPQK